MTDTNKILDALRKLYAQGQRIEHALAALATAKPASPAANVAPDHDLDRSDGYGDPEIKRDPKRWTGEPLAPIRMSAAPADYLDAVAEFKGWQAGMEEAKGDDEAKKKARVLRLDAARARGWAARARARPPADEPPAEL